MTRAAFLGVLLPCIALRAGAQIQPEVEVVPLLKEKRPHLLASQVVVADCNASGLSGAQREEVASVKVTIRGSWERSAKHLASEKAAELGANCLLVVSSSGEDDAQYPVYRSYRAFRVTVPYGPWRVLASAESLASVTTAATTPAFPMPKLKTPVIERKSPETHGDHLRRAMGEAVYVHEVTLDPTRADPEEWKDVLQDVREYFGAAEAEKLERLSASGRPVRIDLRAGTVSNADR